MGIDTNDVWWKNPNYDKGGDLRAVIIIVVAYNWQYMWQRYELSR